MTQQIDPNDPYPGPQPPPPGSDPNPPTGQKPCAVTKEPDGHFYATIGNVKYKLVPQEQPVLEDIADTVQG